MYLSYLDDSGSDRKSPIVLIGAVLVPDVQIRELEMLGGLAISNFIPEEKWGSFKEFHAAELFHGHGIFDGIDEPVRHGIIEGMLRQVVRLKIPCIYSAVRKSVFENGVLGSANPVDVAFRMCVLGIQRYLVSHTKDETALVIFDDTKDTELKTQLQKSFREFRPQFRPPYWKGPHRLFNIHDGMYFGSSMDSIGIQMADLCSYFILRKLKGETGAFYNILADHIICAKIEPEWSQYRHMFAEDAKNGNEKRVREIRSDDASSDKDSAQPNQGQTGRREDSQSKKA
jgi:hypothetical protein